MRKIKMWGIKYWKVKRVKEGTFESKEVREQSSPSPHLESKACEMDQKNCWCYLLFLGQKTYVIGPDILGFTFSTSNIYSYISNPFYWYFLFPKYPCLFLVNQIYSPRATAETNSFEVTEIYLSGWHLPTNVSPYALVGDGGRTQDQMVKNSKYLPLML
jgi:hypothetical protein